MVVTENPTALQIAASARFHGRDAASIGYLYDWYDAIPEMLEPKEELKQRILKTNGVHRKDDEKLPRKHSASSCWRSAPRWD